jgi:tight adherence protein B
MDSQDLRFLAVAVSIQQQSGGNLAEILDGSGQGDPRPVQAVPPRQGHHGRSKMVGHVPVGLPDRGAGDDHVLKPDYYDGVKETLPSSRPPDRLRASSWST